MSPVAQFADREEAAVGTRCRAIEMRRDRMGWRY
jgi:hypothetical protein